MNSRRARYLKFFTKQAIYYSGAGEAMSDLHKHRLYKQVKKWWTKLPRNLKDKAVRDPDPFLGNVADRLRRETIDKDLIEPDAKEKLMMESS